MMIRNFEVRAGGDVHDGNNPGNPQWPEEQDHLVCRAQSAQPLPRPRFCKIVEIAGCHVVAQTRIPSQGSPALAEDARRRGVDWHWDKGPSVVPQSLQDYYEAKLLFLAVPFCSQDVAKKFKQWNSASRRCPQAESSRSASPATP